jgi:serine/threonine protein kinase
MMMMMTMMITGFVRLTDLGLCSFIKRDNRLHRHCGTRSYMAPEQCSGPQGYGKQVDWWSLGVTITHLLTGKVYLASLRLGSAPPGPHVYYALPRL